jgi:Ca2+-dependent lipid-binding protein
MQGVLQDFPSSLVDFLLTFDWPNGNIWGVVLLCLAYLCGLMGVGASVLFVLVLSGSCYVYRRLRRMRRREVWSLHDVLSNPDVARLILEKNLPAWVTYGVVERSKWLQQTVENLWPHISAATTASMLASMPAVLDLYKPVYLSSLRMSKFDLGTVPITIDGVQCHQSDVDTTIDFHIRWDGNPDVRVSAAAGPISVEAAVTSLQLECILRLSLGPHCKCWPCFTGLALSFVGKPNMDFKLKAMKIPFDAIPGYGMWLDGFLRNTALAFMVYPKRYSYSLLGDAVIDASAEPRGTLTLRLMRCEGLPNRVLRKLSSFLKLTLTTADESKSACKRTKTVTGKNPEIRQEMTFVVYDVTHERLIFQLYDDGLKADMMVGLKEKEIAAYTTFVSNLTSKAPGEAFPDSVPLVALEPPFERRGTVFFESIYRPFETAKDTHDVMMQHSLDFSSETEGSPLAKSKTMGNFRAEGLSAGRKLDGVLIVTVVRCESLPKIDLIGSSDPFVTVRIGSHMAKTKVVKDCLNPSFGEEFLLIVDDVSKDSLTVEVDDWDQFMIASTFTDRRLGVTTIPVKEVFESGGRIPSRAFPLHPKGSVVLDLKLRIHSVPQPPLGGVATSASFAGRERADSAEQRRSYSPKNS